MFHEDDVYSFQISIPQTNDVNPPPLIGVSKSPFDLPSLILLYHLPFPSYAPSNERDRCGLESEEEQESHHETEKPHSLGQSKAENGVREELLLERRVPCVADDEGAEDGADTGAGSGNAHRGSAGADVLGRRVNVQRPR